MTEGLGIRIAITLLTAAQAMIAAVLGFGDILPQEYKVGLVAVSAGLAVVLNQIPRWQQAPRAQRAMRRSGVE